MLKGYCMVCPRALSWVRSFSYYTLPVLSKVIQNHPGIHFHFYADDTQLYVHLTHKHATLAFERLKNCLDDVRKWLSVNKLKLNPDKTVLFCSVQKMSVQNLANFSQSIYLVPSCHLLRQSGTLVSGSIQIFPFLPCQEYLQGLFCSYQGFKATQRVSYT